MKQQAEEDPGLAVCPVPGIKQVPYVLEGMSYNLSLT
jgi:hypothetical protein